MSTKTGLTAGELGKHILFTAIGVIVTYYITSAIGKNQHTKDDIEKEKQRMESLEKTNKLLSDYISRYDALHEKYITLLSSGTVADKHSVSKSETPIRLNKLSLSMVKGDWKTADGIEKWSFNDNNLKVSGINNYEGYVEASGQYEASGGNVNGSLQVTRALYLPVSLYMNFNFRLNNEGTVLYGNTTDAEGNLTAVTLYKN